MENDLEFFKDTARNQYIAYCCYINPNFDKDGPHIKLIAEKLEAVERGEIKRLIITAPPRHSKSHNVSELFPSWYLGRNPDKSLIEATYGQDLSDDFGRKVRNIISSTEFQELFPGISTAKDSKAVHRFNTNKGGSYYAVGRGSAITGRGGSCIIDDPLKDDKEANSELIRKNLIQWYKTVLYTRLMKDCFIIVMATRWHQDDLIGYLLNESDEHWDVLNLPAINEKGEALWPQFYPINVLNQIKKTLGTRNFEALYQQNPSPPEGSIIKRSWLKYYTVLPSTMDQYLISWDMAFKGEETSDFVVGTVWAVRGGNFYLIDRIRDRMDFPTTLHSFRQLANSYPEALTKLVEAKANGQAVIDTLNNEIFGIIPIEPEKYGSKESRLNSVAPVFEAGNVFLPSDAPWLHEYIEELVSFPQSKNDDQVDSTSQALIYMTKDSWGVAALDNISSKILM